MAGLRFRLFKTLNQTGISRLANGKFHIFFSFSFYLVAAKTVFRWIDNTRKKLGYDFFLVFSGKFPRKLSVKGFIFYLNSFSFYTNTIIF